jgi:predicted DCC family thiol-disulfide oxidoreductase YuxK
MKRPFRYNRTIESAKLFIKGKPVPMTHPENILPTLSLLYDGDCPMCQATVAKLERGGFLNGLQEVSPLQAAAWASPDLWERGRVEVLLVDTQSGQVWGGIDALIQLFSRKAGFKLLSKILQWPLCHGLAQGAYQMVGYNRRILSPPAPRALPCACDPPVNLTATRNLYTLLVSLIFLSLLAFAQGASFSPARLTHLPVWTLFNALTTATVAGWLSAALVFRLVMKERAQPLLPQTLVSLTVGSLYLVLASVLLLYLPSHAGAGSMGAGGIFGLGLGIQALGMAPSLSKRLSTLGAPAWGAWLWVLTYLASAIGCLWLLP